MAFTLNEIGRDAYHLYFNHKFIWEEMSYLEKWWRDASETKRESFISLVKSRQLEIVRGGWVMNDEVNLLLSKWDEF